MPTDKAKPRDQEFSEEEIARRRDEVVRRMANTPPQHVKSLNRPAGRKKTTAVGRPPRKAGAARKAP
jgi:hypothetical protein